MKKVFLLLVVFSYVSIADDYHFEFGGSSQKGLKILGFAYHSKRIGLTVRHGFEFYPSSEDPFREHGFPEQYYRIWEVSGGLRFNVYLLEIGAIDFQKTLKNPVYAISAGIKFLFDQGYIGIRYNRYAGLSFGLGARLR